MDTQATPSPKRTIVLAALVAGRSWDDIAREAGCSRSTIARVAREHRDDIAQERAERARPVADRLRDAALIAVTAVVDVLENESNNAVRMQAARIALGDALRWLEQVELDDRLRAVEERLALRVAS